MFYCTTKILKFNKLKLNKYVSSSINLYVIRPRTSVETFAICITNIENSYTLLKSYTHNND